MSGYVNKIELTLTLGRDVEVRTTRGGKTVASASGAFSVGKDDKRRTTWIKLTAWDDAAEAFAGYRKGQRVTVVGRFGGVDTYTKRDGTTAYEPQITVDAATPLERDPPNVQKDDGIPF